MRIYEDYFDRGLRKKAYSSGSEEREDYLKFLDMILEACLEFRGLHSKGKLYSRGLVITENEIRSYFEMPPGSRERDVCDPLLAESVREAFDHISDRLSFTERDGRDGEPVRERTLPEEQWFLLFCFWHSYANSVLSVTWICSHVTVAKARNRRKFRKR